MPFVYHLFGDNILQNSIGNNDEDGGDDGKDSGLLSKRMVEDGMRVI